MKSKDRNNVHLDILSTRLREVREENNLTQLELAKKVNERGTVKITTEKINYCELNIEGRKLQIEELVEIADILNVSIDYLTGRTQSKTNAVSNGLSDKRNEMIAEWGDDTLGVIDMLIQKFNDEEIIIDLKAYVFISYVTTNILSGTLLNIEEKVKENSNISHLETQQMAFLKDYINYFEKQKTTCYRTAWGIVDRHKRVFVEAEEECEKILSYNNNKDVEINFSKIMTLNLVWDLFKVTLKNGLEERIKVTLDKIVKTTSKDNKYFNKIKKFFKEVNYQ